MIYLIEYIQCATWSLNRVLLQLFCAANILLNHNMFFLLATLYLETLHNIHKPVLTHFVSTRRRHDGEWQSGEFWSVLSVDR